MAGIMLTSCCVSRDNCCTFFSKVSLSVFSIYLSYFACKGSANRAKYQRNINFSLYFSNLKVLSVALQYVVQPTFTKSDR